jgi:hypothetical protein
MTYACPVRDSEHTQVGERRSAIPVLMNKLYGSRAAAREALLGPLEIVFCQDRGFTWNTQFDPDLITYDESYENDQTHSLEFQAHMEAPAVLPPEDAAQKGPRSIFLMNPMYHREVRERAAQAGLTAEIIPLNKSESHEN